MKHSKLLIATILACLLFAACTDTRKITTQETDTLLVDSAEVCETPTILPQPTAQAWQVMGIVGDGTSMHSLELLLGNGDSLYIEYDDNAMGGLLDGERVYVAYNETDGEYVASTIININRLAHTWTVEGSEGKKHLELDKHGAATSYGMNHRYNRWSIDNGLLILSNSQTADTCRITQLSDETMQLQAGDNVLRFTRWN